jgi:hypothetical protein
MSSRAEPVDMDQHGISAGARRPQSQRRLQDGAPCSSYGKNIHHQNPRYTNRWQSACAAADGCCRNVLLFWEQCITLPACR